MKQHWTRLIRLFYDGRESHHLSYDGYMRNLFLRHHKNADELITSKCGNPLAVIYFTPTGADRLFTKSLFRKIRERLLYEEDLEEKKK